MRRLGLTSVERLAVHLQARRLAGLPMILRCSCGGIGASSACSTAAPRFPFRTMRITKSTPTPARSSTVQAVVIPTAGIVTVSPSVETLAPDAYSAWTIRQKHPNETRNTAGIESSPTTTAAMIFTLCLPMVSVERLAVQLQARPLRQICPDHHRAFFP